MTLRLRPHRGGFLRPFGCGQFIREYLLGHGPFEAPAIDPEVGAPQADIFREYKLALMKATAFDRAVRTEEKRAKRERRPIDPDRIEYLTEQHLKRIPYKAWGCRYHSFVVYFSNVIRLGWVEATGKEETSEFQDYFPPGPARKFYRLTQVGRQASEDAWSNPQRALYGQSNAQRTSARTQRNRPAVLPAGYTVH